MKPSLFSFGDAAVRVFQNEHGIWFVAADVCRVLQLRNISMALERLDEDERTLITIEGASNGLPVNAINESGLYSLILTSRKPQAKSFKKWVTSVVLPSIRKTGGFTVQPENDLASWAFASLRKMMPSPKLMEALMPLHRFGSLAKGGGRRIGFRRCSYTTTPGRAAVAFQVSDQEVIMRRMLTPELPAWKEAAHD